MTCKISTQNYGDVAFIKDQEKIIGITERQYFTVYLIIQGQGTLHSVSGFDSLTKPQQLQAQLEKIHQESSPQSQSAVIAFKQHQLNHTAEQIKRFLEIQQISYQILDVEAFTVEDTNIVPIPLTDDLRQNNKQYYEERVIRFCKEKLCEEKYDNLKFPRRQQDLELLTQEGFSTDEESEDSSTRSTSPTPSLKDDLIPLIVDDKDSTSSYGHTTSEGNDSSDGTRTPSPQEKPFIRSQQAQAQEITI